MRLQCRHFFIGLVLAAGMSIVTQAQTPVQPVPFVVSQWFDNNGRPASGGCIATLASGTSTPIASYSESTGTILNANPVQLDSAGRANIFLTATAYTLKLYSRGSSGNCSSSVGPQIWSIDGINPAANSILGSNNIWTGNQTYNGAVTFDTQPTFTTGFTAAGPVNLGLGGSLAGTFTGTPTFAGSLNFAAGFTSTTGSFSDQITSTLVTGTAPFVIASTTQVANLNVAALEGFTWEVPGTIGSTTPNSGAFTTLSYNGIGLSGTCSTGQILTATSSSAVSCQNAPSSAVAVQAFCSNAISNGVSLTAGAVQIATCSVTTPATGCPCRVQFAYATTIVKVSAGTGVGEWVSSSTADSLGATTWASAAAGESNASSGGAAEVGATAFSPGTFAGSTSITFALNAQRSSGSYTLNSTPLSGSGPSMQFQVAVFTSN